MKKTIILCSIATLFAASFTLHANEKLIKKMDKDGDSRISVEEFTAKSKKKGKATKRFEAIDLNKDGFLSVDELAKMPTKAKK
ncbi:MAG: hypothetical protein ACSHWT_06090 [Glaciecola sp.]